MGRLQFTNLDGDGKIKGYKACGREKGETRSKYPSCRPTPAKCKDKGKGTNLGKNKMTPYTDIEVTDKYIIREFNENIDPIELMWHRDDESRTIEILGETNWQLQLENSLPTSLKERIFIERHQWHRVIKGTGTLKLKIHKQ
jgi:hypothetical protein